jgi:hypothetical protein
MCLCCRGGLFNLPGGTEVTITLSAEMKVGLITLLTMAVGYSALAYIAWREMKKKYGQHYRDR